MYACASVILTQESSLHVEEHSTVGHVLCSFTNRILQIDQRAVAVAICRCLRPVSHNPVILVVYVRLIEHQHGHVVVAILTRASEQRLAGCHAGPAGMTS